MGDTVTFAGRRFRAYNHHISDASTTPHDAGPGGVGGGRNHWVYEEDCNDSCDLPWNGDFYYPANFEVFHNGKVWRAKWEQKMGQEPGEQGSIGWEETAKDCTPPPPPGCWADDVNDPAEPSWDENKTDYNGEKVIHNGAVWKHCGEDGCMNEPGFSIWDGSNNGCWVFLGSCLGPRTCDDAPNWENDVWYYRQDNVMPHGGDTVRYKGNLYRSYKNQINKRPSTEPNFWGYVEMCNECENLWDN